MTGAIGQTAPNGDVLSQQTINGLDGPAVQIIALTAAKAASLILVPEATASESGNTSQLLLYGKSGTDYNRFGISNNNTAIIIDSTYNGSGAARPIAIQAGGSVSNAITGQTAIKVTALASVDLIGSINFTAGGRSGWAPTATRVADIADTGSSRLIIDTRTTTPASNVADASLFELRRGGASKWLVGLNANGSNVDSFDVYSNAGSILGLSVLSAGGLQIRSDSTNGNPALLITNTAASGHAWRLGELNGVGVLDFRDVTASGAPMMLGLDGTNKRVIIRHQLKFDDATFEATGAGSALLGANCPAVTASAPYTWEKIVTSDGSTGYIPVWK